MALSFLAVISPNQALVLCLPIYYSRFVYPAKSSYEQLKMKKKRTIIALGTSDSDFSKLSTGIACLEFAMIYLLFKRYQYFTVVDDIRVKRLPGVYIAVSPNEFPARPDALDHRVARPFPSPPLSHPALFLHLLSIARFFLPLLFYFTSTRFISHRC